MHGKSRSPLSSLLPLYQTPASDACGGHVSHVDFVERRETVKGSHWNQFMQDFEAERNAEREAARWFREATDFPR